MKVGLFGLHRGSAGPVDLELGRRYGDLGVDRLVVQPATTEGGAIDELIETMGSSIVGQV